LQPQNLHPKSAMPSFISYIWQNSWNRAWWWLSLCAFILQFALFKSYYPHASFMTDSYSYLEAAYINADVNMWPVAYSKFLRLVSAFTHSDTATVAFQYLFMQASMLLFLFSLFYFLRPGKVVRNTLFIFLLLNPLPLYVANTISADALFIGFSLCWMSSLIWIIYAPTRLLIPLQAALLLACFTLRYNAIYYPLIAMLAFALSHQNLRPKLAGIGLSLILLFASYSYTSGTMKEVTGHRQFSAFGGWQMANNALYMYEHIPASQRGPIPVKYVKLETMVRQHMDTLRKVKLSHDDSVNTYFYLWSARAPLVQYMEREWKKDSTTPYFKRWASEGSLYFDYASYLIRRYPWTFVKSFVIPNTLKLVMPPTEFLGVYNMGRDSVSGLAKAWFQYKSLKVANQHGKDQPIALTAWYPIFSVLVNLLLLIHLIGLFAFGGLKNHQLPLPRLLALAVAFWVLNAGFSIFASPIVLRYQIFPLLIAFTIALLAGEIIYKTPSPKSATK